MSEHCHRCHAELPQVVAGSSRNDEDALLFCPRCGAPQILLPEHMRNDPPPDVPLSTTGAVPPPRPRHGPTGSGQVEWHAALTSIALVAAIGGILTGLGMKFGGTAAFLSGFWTFGAAVTALGIYAHNRPQAWMDARIGLRVGIATGLLLSAAMAIATSATGVIMRFGTHSAAARDAESAQELAAAEAQAADWMQLQNQPREVQEKFHGFIHSPEALAGSALFRFGLLGGMIVLVSAGGGAFAGMLRATRATRAGLGHPD